MSTDLPRFSYTGDDARRDQDISDMSAQLFELIHGEFIPKIRQAAKQGFSQVVIPAMVSMGRVNLGGTVTHMGDGVIAMSLPIQEYDWVTFVRMMRNQGFDVCEDYGRQITVSWRSL